MTMIKSQTFDELKEENKSKKDAFIKKMKDKESIFLDQETGRMQITLDKGETWHDASKFPEKVRSLLDKKTKYSI